MSYLTACRGNSATKLTSSLYKRNIKKSVRILTDDIFKVKISRYEIIKFKHKNNYIDIKKEWRPKITV